MIPTRRRSARPVIVLAGPGPQSAGGVWSVISTVLRSPLADTFDLIPVTTHRDGGAGPKAVAGLRGMARIVHLLIRRNPPELIWLHTASGWSFRRKAVIAMMARLRGVPYVLHVHGAEIHLWYRAISAPERMLVRSVLRGARCVVALSPRWERRLRDITLCATTSVVNPVEIPPARERSPVAGRIVSTGRLGDRKGSRVLVRATALLREQGLDVQLHLAGDGEKEQVRAEAERVGVADIVTFHPWLSRDEVAQLLDSSAVFALPSREEGVPVSLLEAMAHQLPVVATPVGGIPDIVEDGTHGFLVPPDDPEALADALARVLRDPVSSRDMGSAGRRHVRREASIDVFVTRLRGLLTRCLSD